MINIDIIRISSKDQIVSLAYEGSTPDIGAYEYVPSVQSDTTPPSPPTGLKLE